MSDDRTTTPIAVHPEDLDAANADDASIIGTTLHDTYKVVRFMAEGGMGRVYEAQHTRISTKRFAIKVLHGELKNSLEVRMRFRREAEAAASIEHPNVVGVHDFGYAPDGRPYLVCDYLEGIELGGLLEDEKPVQIVVATSIGRQLCRALEAAHDQGVIHRDLKPANVFLVGSLDEPEVRVLDFGLSRVVELAEASVTQTGIVMGTPQFMSPEQARGERADHRVDVYGVGAVLYSSLTGVPPYNEESPHKTVLAVMSREPPRPCALNPAIPPELEVIVQKAMARDPADRYSTMRELETALARFEELYAKRGGPRPVSLPDPMIQSGAGAQSPTNNVSEARGIRRRAVGWMVLAGALLIIGGLSTAIGIYSVMAPNRPLLPTELVLGTLGVLGSIFTPFILLLGWLRRRYWTNSAKMVNLVAALRGPVLAGAFAYAVAALATRSVDVVGPHVSHGMTAPNASGWVGWAPFFFGLAVLAALAALVRHALLVNSETLGRRILAGPFVVGGALIGSAAILATGYRMGAAATPAPSPIASISAEPTASATATASSPARAPLAGSSSAKVRGSATASTSVSAGASASASAEPVVADKDHAPKEELGAAVSGGVGPLMALRSKYPKDPKVLKPLALALSKEPGRASELLRVLDALFAEAPDEANDETLAGHVRDAAIAPATSVRAFELMRSRMGSKGADMLFDLMLTRSELKARARSALETAEVQRALSPALKIAYDLLAAPTCTARADLLPQADRDGDERAITVLTIYMSKSKTGCGPKNRKPCPAICEKEAGAFEATMTKIRKRLANQP